MAWRGCHGAGFEIYFQLLTEELGKYWEITDLLNEKLAISSELLKFIFNLSEFVMTAHPLSRRLWLALRAAISAALLGTVVAPAAWAQSPKSALNLAMVGEPQALDPMASTADLVGTIMQHVFETLYTFDAKWNVVPMLAEGMPTASRAALAAFNRETQSAKRAALWGAVQKVVCDEVPSINVGKFSSLSARSPALDAFQPATWAFF